MKQRCFWEKVHVKPLKTSYCSMYCIWVSESTCNQCKYRITPSEVHHVLRQMRELIGEVRRLNEGQKNL